jgi:DNA modification methylase
MSGAEEPGAVPGGKTKRNDLQPTLEITERSPKELVASNNQVRKPKPEHVKRIVRSIERFGFSVPPLIRGDETVDGHARVLAARELGLEKIPCIDISHLTDDEARLLRLAVNKLQEQGAWDETALALEFAYHLEFNTDLSVTGFDAWEIDAALEIGATISEEDPDDDFGPLPDPDATSITRPDDLWRLNDSFVLCGNARSPEDVQKLVGDMAVALVLADGPFNVPIYGHVSSDRRHPEFHEGSGEMADDEYVDFLAEAHGLAASQLPPGGLVYTFIDWRHLYQMQTALQRIGLQQIQLCVWAKEHPGMGSFYRSQHELVVVAKVPGAPHKNNIQLGAHGRNRSNLWRFAGKTGGQADEDDNFDVHPTVKPIRLIEEAILDVTAPGDVVLDPFLGSGSTLLAAHRTQRRCLGLEISPAYVDVAILRWQAMTGEQAVLVATGEPFEVVARARVQDSDPTSQGEF